MHRRARTPTMRPLTLEETAQVARLIDEVWPGRAVARQYVEWNQDLTIVWQPGSGPVSQVRLPLNYLNNRPANAAPVKRKDTSDAKFLSAIPTG